MEKSKFANIALILALLSLVSPLLAILASQGIIPKIAIYGGLLVSGTGLMGVILGFLGYKETEHKWKAIAAIIIAVVGLIVDIIFSFGVIGDLIQELMSGLL
jgi:FtsH-binding integral membrane protein